jgi:hypothetical protein
MPPRIPPLVLLVVGQIADSRSRRTGAFASWASAKCTTTTPLHPRVTPRTNTVGDRRRALKYVPIFAPCLNGPAGDREHGRARHWSARDPLLDVRQAADVTDAERLHEIEQKFRCAGYMSHPDAERDVVWLLDRLAERDAPIAEWKRGGSGESARSR